MTRRRLSLWIGLGLTVVAVSVALPALRGLGGSGGIGSDQLPTYAVQRGEFVRRVHAEGNLEAAQATLLGPPPTVRGSMRIAWLIPDGTRVETDDVVIRFDPTDIEKKLRDGKSDRQTADSRITQKKVREEGTARNLERDADIAVRELEHARKFQSKDTDVFSRVDIVESEIDEVLASQRKEHADDVRGIRHGLAGVELDLLAIERRKAELEIEEAESDLQKLEVRAPHDGIFVLKDIWGTTPQIGTVIWGGNAVAEIPKLDEMEAKIYVLEADAGGLEVGVKATLILDAHPDHEFRATAKKVDALAMRRSRQAPVQYFGVLLELEATDPEIMKPGQRVRAVLVLDELDDVITVPRQAVFEVDGSSVVYVRRSGEFEPTEVKLGPSAMGRIVIEDGLNDNDIVALRDPTRPLFDDDDGEDASNGGVGGVRL